MTVLREPVNGRTAGGGEGTGVGFALVWQCTLEEDTYMVVLSECR